MTKNYQMLKGRGGLKSPGKSPKRLNTSVRRRSGSLKSLGSSSDGGGGGASANIRVAVRVRPENERELAGAFRNVINVVDNQMLVFDPKEEDDAFYYHGRKQGRRDLNKRQNKDKKFTFDAVYAPDSVNNDVFEGTTKDLIETVFQGYNCSVFAYGATGSGKTFTMLGGKENKGLTYLTLEEIYLKVENLSAETSCEIGISYLEVYNETVRDLLRPDGILNIREDGKQGTVIPGLSVHKPASPQDVLKLLSYGNGNRTQHPTDANKESSRSHAVLQVYIQQKSRDAGLSAEVKAAKLSMIDLAGSEKGCVTGNKGARFREGSNINKSLLALGNCINALAAGSKYIPYRDSKLTRLLKESIGGNCRTVMIANVSPSSETFEDTFNTLNYADRAKKIKVDLKKNVHNVDFHVAKYAKIVEDLRGEISVLKERIRVLEQENTALQSGGASKVDREGSNVEEMETGGDEAENVMDGTRVGLEEQEEDQESAAAKISRYQAQLARLLERQQEYDSLQERLANSERLLTMRDSEIKTLEGSQQTQAESEEVIKLRDIVRRQAEYISKLEENKHSENEDEQLTEALITRKRLVESYSNEQSILATLMLRSHFKKQQKLRGDLISLTQIGKEQSEMKTSKALESMQRKIEKKRERVDKLKVELERNAKQLEEMLLNNPDSRLTRLCHLEISATEHQAESCHLQEVVSLLGREVERLSEDMVTMLPILTKNEKLLRGHSILSTEDKARFDSLHDTVMSNQQISWAHNLNNSVCEEVEGCGSVYQQAASLHLPSLLPPTRPRSVEQKALFQDSCLMDTFNSTTTGNQISSPPPSNEKPLTTITISAEDDDEEGVAAFPPSPPASAAFPPSSPPTTVVFPASSPPTDPLLPASSPSTLPPTPQVLTAPSTSKPLLRKVLARVEDTLLPGVEDTLLPATPQLSRQNSATLRHLAANSTTNTSFMETPSRGDISGAVTASTVPASPSSAAAAAETKNVTETGTPKRAIELSPSEGGVGGKKVKLDETYIPTEANETSIPSGANETYLPTGANVWLDHRENTVIPTTPTAGPAAAPGVGATNLNQTFDADDVAGGEEQEEEAAPPASGLNETITLVTRLDRQCDLASTDKTSVRTLNFTFAKDEEEVVAEAIGEKEKENIEVEGEEPMDVDPTLDLSRILPPRHGVQLLPRSISPVKAGLGVSPINKKRSPSPLRQSTMLDLRKPQQQPQQQQHAAAGKTTTGANSAKLGPPKSRGRTTSNSATPQPGKKVLGRRALASSQSTSVLPKPDNNQPLSFRSTIQRLHEGAGVGGGHETARDGHVGGHTYMQATAASKLKQGPDRKKGTTPATASAGSKFTKMKKSVSSTVLRQNNK